MIDFDTEKLIAGFDANNEKLLAELDAQTERIMADITAELDVDIERLTDELDAGTNMNTENKIIRSLALALRESLNWSLVEDKEPPYRVPSAIQGDLWEFTECKSRAKALATIDKAVKAAAGITYY